ncbi:hypothetical protein AVEN_22060-1, partial [Araneus ventricosus]
MEWEFPFNGTKASFGYAVPTRRWNTDVDQFTLKVLQENNLSPYTNVQVRFLPQVIPICFKIASSTEKKL